MPSKSKPPFKQVKRVVSTYAGPEELFKKLSGRASTHGYLRGPQQDVLREYVDKHRSAGDVAFELPTGTGKTTVGLLVAEWRRLQGDKVAYLALTNQLAGQVLLEARRLGLSCADLRGDKDTRDSAEEGRYRTKAAVAVTTYSNLFNTNPVIRDADLIILDDAHGGEQYVSDMWTVSANLTKNPGLFNSLLAAIRPGLSESQIRVIFDQSAFGAVELVDVCGHPECFHNVTDVLDSVTSDKARYAWKLIKHRIHCCLHLVSPYEITIRPLVPPTHTHAPFASSKQRIYMSATLGGESDLLRAYGISKLSIARAKSEQWGRRYVFVPGVYTDESAACETVAKVWDRMKTRRAVLLAPSDRILDRSFESLETCMTHRPARMGASDIEDTVDGFIASKDTILALARYDGLDLPDEQCRLLILSESPAAVNPLERHLSERWKMGPVLRRRERTRLTQGMGRCTRNATDFAAIFWLGQSLVNSATSSALVNGLPAELAAEVLWGVEQSELAGTDPGQFVDMILALIEDADYRKAADTAIESIQEKQPNVAPKDYEDAGVDEVRYARAIWEENFVFAHQIAHGIADHIVSPELSGYRAWWWFLGSIAASLMSDGDAEEDCLKRGSSCGVNSGWLNQILQHRTTAESPNMTSSKPTNAEALWDQLTKWGWAGPEFEQRIVQMLERLADPAYVGYHQGLEILGKCFGATVTRSTEPGAPDLVWSFPNDFHIAYEAKTEKKVSGLLSKKDLQEAKGHPEWVRAHLCDDRMKAIVEVVVVAPSPSLHQIALPFAGGLFYVEPEKVLILARQVVENLRKMRVKFSGREFAGCASEFATELQKRKLDLDSMKKAFLSEPLKR